MIVFHVFCLGLTEASASPVRLDIREVLIGLCQSWEALPSMTSPRQTHWTEPD